MKSLIKLLHQEDRLVTMFNEQLYTMQMAAQNIKEVNELPGDNSAKRDDLARYRAVIETAKDKSAMLAKHIVVARADIEAAISADRVSNVLTLQKEIEDIMLKG